MLLSITHFILFFMVSFSGIFIFINLGKDVQIKRKYIIALSFGLSGLFTIYRFWM